MTTIDSAAYIEIPPDTHLVASLQQQRPNYSLLFAEAVDNALDVGSTDIAILIRPHEIIISDNGIGITRDRELAILQLGAHAPVATTRLGMFGVGIKYQVVRTGNVLEVASTSRDGRVWLKAEWSQMLRRGRWMYPKPRWISAPRGASTGTDITISDLRWALPTRMEREKIRSQLAEMFYPALADGITIRLDDDAVPLLQEPALRNLIENDVYISAGKGAHVWGGLLIDNGPMHRTSVSYGHRIILPNSGFGLGEYGGTRQMFARVHLIGQWQLSTFKDDVIDPDTETLDDAVQDLLRPILEQCHSRQLSAQIEEMQRMLNEMLPEDLQPARPTRTPGTDAPARQRKTARPPHRPTRAGTPQGPARMPQAHQGLIIEFEPALVEAHGYGYFVPGRPNRIILAEDNPDIATWLALRDKAAGIRSLYAIALMIYEQAKEMWQGNQMLLNSGQEPFGLRVWNLARRQKHEREE